MAQTTNTADSVPQASPITSTCSSCGTTFSPSKPNKGVCAKCGCPTCDSCLSQAPRTESLPSSVLAIPSPLCSKCLPTINPDVTRYQQAIVRAGTIVSFPQTSKGKTGIDNSRPTLSITSDGCETYQDAEFQLKVACAFLGYDLVVERSYSKQQVRGSAGRSEWIAIGKLGYKSA